MVKPESRNGAIWGSPNGLSQAGRISMRLSDRPSAFVSQVVSATFPEGKNVAPATNSFPREASKGIDNRDV